jgi:protease-4
VQAVASARHLPVADVRNIADGRVILGSDALKLKLIDQLGNYQDAVLEAGRLGGIKGEPKVQKAETGKSSLLNFLIGSQASARLNDFLADSSACLMYKLQGFGP